MSKLFRPKTMRRMVVFLAMIAPAVYLFGVSFSALTGSHGQEVLADGDVVVGYEDYSIDSVLENGDFENLDNWYYYNYPAVFSLSDGGIYVTTTSSYTAASLACSSVSFTDGHKYFVSFYANNVGSTPFAWVLLRFPASQVTSTVEFLPQLTDYHLYFEAESSFTRFEIVFNGGGYGTSTGFVKDFYIVDLTDSFGYGNEPTESDFLNKYWRSFYPFGFFSYSIPLTGEGSYSQQLENRFFADGNILEQWGKNAISESPLGFAPFGAFWRYLDVNVLHLSNDQAGLMAYGYMYYASHVLLFDVGFILVSFFLTFIQKVADKIGGEDHV